MNNFELSVPVLSRGKHRNPRKGACFMEFASYLAGERWSDHPACTHPLLSALARLVNDHTSDDGRQRLAVLVPSVIGLTSDDLHVDARIALRSAALALPVAAAERQRVLAVAIVACDRILAGLDGRSADRPGAQARAILDQVPLASRWAQEFSRDIHPSEKSFRRHGAPNIVLYAVSGIARACIPDPDAMLRDLLVAGIAECNTSIRGTSIPDTARPAGSAVASQSQPLRLKTT
jgi:hypothetical protein